MPKRKDIDSILIIGAGPIIIGQACEFDYSGTQATRALKEEGFRVILVNSNPATIMTDPDIADATYIEPITTDYVEAIIQKEKPDAILPTVGGQTALNIAIAAKPQKLTIFVIFCVKNFIEKIANRIGINNNIKFKELSICIYNQENQITVKDRKKPSIKRITFIHLPGFVSSFGICL